MLAIRGNPLIGLYIRANEHAAVLGVDDEAAKQMLKDKLDVEVVVTTIAGSELVGAMAAANSNGIAISSHATSKEIERLSKVFDVHVIETHMTCLGNIVCVNDRGAIVHPEAEEKLVAQVSKALDVDVVKGTIGGIKTVGMAAAVTNNGGLLNPNANEWEIKRVEEALGVEVGVGTVNFGHDMVGTGLVANTKGYIAGRDTTGFELGVIEEALGFVRW
ncbi:translation initiation factor IF-6 [Archaeoglobus veneficus]|uniref:Translation initiation factor 6 n=1 Tax=Archaeoglobus veneficus (strain DSM 11195 / SNP6) TaxID=693661 RepID=F2KQV5_ARCVS|nr:translation initiation factor IF-6 [Archaeoglobus veneficus]AEA47761.1 Translation initiation factor 6 [Archaeoglobus veneficus SNP6]